MRTSVLLPAVLFLAIPVVASAQIKPLANPTNLTVAAITLRAVRIDTTTSTLRLKYTRAGTKPTEYRTSNNSAFTGASWLSFTEGATTSFTSGSTTWITGFVALPPTLTPGGGCGPNSFLMKVFFQFRARNGLQQTITSNVASDTLCTFTS